MARLTDQQDAFGHAMYNAYRGKPAYDVYERDDGVVVVAAAHATNAFRSFCTHLLKTLAAIAALKEGAVPTFRINASI